MHNIRTIARRELSSYFNSPVAYIVVVVFLLIAGWMYFGSLFLYGRADMRTFFAPSPFSPSMLLVIIAPAITMRLVAEERKQKTLELLTTMPITDTEVILGKFLGALLLLLAALAVTLVYAVTVTLLGPLDWGPVISGYVGLMLFSAALLAIGVFTSTLTDNQIVAFIMAFIVSAALYFVYWLQFFMPTALAGVVEFVSLSFHLDNLARGVIDSRDVFYYLTLTAGSLFLAIRSLGRLHA
jgi:ABC-2 type transport system permease protein